MWSVSPFPLQLKDGRIVLIYMRRCPDPIGLYALLSEDQGATWSMPVCLRDDTLRAGPIGVIDGDYPVAVQMADNRIFTSYYWQHDDLDMPLEARLRQQSNQCGGTVSAVAANFCRQHSLQAQA